MSLADLDTTELRDIFGDGVLDLTTEKKESKPKRKSQKKRPPRRQPVNLDALMDGLDGVEKNSFTDHSTYESKKFTSSVFSPFERLEKNVASYLDRALEFCIDDVIAEVTQMMEENDPFEACIPNFLEEMRDVLKEMIVLGNDSPFDKTTDIQVIFDDFSSSFLTSFKQAEQFRNSNHPEKARAARLAISAITNRKSQLTSDMSRLMRDMKTELIELGELRQQLNQCEAELARRQRRYRKSSGDIETRKLFVEADSVATKRSLELLKDMIHKVTSYTVSETFDDFGIGDSIRRKLSEIRGELHNLGRIELPKLIIYDVLREKQENRALRQAFEYGFGTFVNSLAIQRRPIPPQYVPQRQVFDSPPRNYEYHDPLELSNSRLRRIQERRDTDMENLSRFLGKVQKKGENVYRNEDEEEL